MCVAGLDAMLFDTGLEPHSACASAWCERMGPRDLQEIAEDDVFDDFVEALKLRPLEKRRLRKALLANIGLGSNLPAVSAQVASDKSSTYLCQTSALASKGVAVSFKKALSCHDGIPRLTELQRSRSDPTPKCPQNDAEVEEEADGNLDATACSSPTNLAPSPTSLFPTVTFDGYEQHDACPVANVDPNTLTVALGGFDGYEQFDEWFWADGESMMVGGAANAAETSSHFSEQIGLVMMPMEVMPSPFVLAYPLGQPQCWPEKQARPQTLEQAFSEFSQIYRIRWSVDARKLDTTDKEAVSPAFELAGWANAQFKMVMRPKRVEDSRGGASFKKARGKGSVQLKLVNKLEEAAHLSVMFRLAVGNPISWKRRERPRGPVRHDFFEKPICGLPEGRDEWDFRKAVDDATQTFVVSLDVLSITLD